MYAAGLTVDRRSVRAEVSASLSSLVTCNRSFLLRPRLMLSLAPKTVNSQHLILYKTLALLYVILNVSYIRRHVKNLKLINRKPPKRSLAC